MDTLERPQKSRLVYLIAISAIGAAYGIYLLADCAIFASSAVETGGVVVARAGSNFTIQYTVSGQTYQIKQSLPSTKGTSGKLRSKLQPGYTVSVLYDPESPSNARWNNAIWAWPVAVTVVSIIVGFTVI